MNGSDSRNEQRQEQQAIAYAHDALVASQSFAVQRFPDEVGVLPGLPPANTSSSTAPPTVLLSGSTPHPAGSEHKRAPLVMGKVANATIDVVAVAELQRLQAEAARESQRLRATLREVSAQLAELRHATIRSRGAPRWIAG